MKKLYPWISARPVRNVARQPEQTVESRISLILSYFSFHFQASKFEEKSNPCQNWSPILTILGQNTCQKKIL